MTDKSPINPGKVEWSGENPGIYLRDEPEGPWITLAVFGRVVVSPHGRGHFLLLLERPDEATGLPDVANVLLTDNDLMMDYILRDFVSKFPTFRDRAGLTAMTRLQLESVKTSGDAHSAYTETVAGGDVEIMLTWREFGEPFAVDVDKDQSATGEHQMYSLFVEAGSAEITVNGRVLKGNVYPRQFFGRPMSSAFLAFSETWLSD